jgi:hypothetical protein
MAEVLGRNLYRKVEAFEEKMHSNATNTGEN